MKEKPFKYFTQSSSGDFTALTEKDLPSDARKQIQTLMNQGIRPENEIEERILNLLHHGKNFDALRALEEANNQLDSYEQLRLQRAFHRILNTRINSRLDAANLSLVSLDPQIDKDYETLRNFGTFNPSQVSFWIYHLVRTNNFEKSGFLARAAVTIFPPRGPERRFRKFGEKSNSLHRALQDGLLAHHYVNGNLEEAVNIQLNLVDKYPDAPDIRNKLKNIIRSVESQAREALSEHLINEESQYGLKHSATRAQSNDMDFDSLARVSKMLKERATRPMILVAFDMLRSESFEASLASAHAILRLSPHNPDSWELARSTALRCIELASIHHGSEERRIKVDRCMRLIQKVETLCA